MENVITIETEKLKEAVSRAYKGSGRIPILQITMVMGIEVKDGDMIFTTTDNTTNLKIVLKGVAPAETNFYVCTDSDLFYKLISKTTSNNVTLELRDKSLLFKGNGAYNLPIIADIEGEGAIRIKPMTVSEDAGVKIVRTDWLKLLEYNKNSVAKSLEVPCFVGYCVSEGKCITYNNNTACVSDVAWNDSKMLIPQAIVNLLDVVSEDAAMLYVDDRKIKIASTSVEITGTLLEGYDKYPVSALTGLATSDQFKNTIKVDKAILASTLDRLSLFVNAETRNTITLNIGKDALFITSKDTSGSEKVEYIESAIENSMESCVDINDIKTIISTLKEDFVTIKYGHDIGILISEENICQIVPFISPEEE